MKLSLIKIILSLFFAGKLISLTNLFADDLIHQESLEKSCTANNFTVKNLFSSDPVILQKINQLEHSQGRFSTCFAFSARIQQLYLEFMMNHQDFSLAEFIHTCCTRNQITEGGHTYVALFNIQKKGSLSCEKNSPFDYQKLTESLLATGPQACHYQIEVASYEGLKNNYQSWNELEEYLNSQKNSVRKLQPANLYAQSILQDMAEKYQRPLVKGQIKLTEARSLEDNLSFIRKYFENPKLSLKYSPPININYCPEIEKNGECKKDSGHAVIVTGMRVACCRDKCQEEWQIKDSSSPNLANEGWLSAAPLASAMEKYQGGNFTEYYPCSSVLHHDHADFFDEKFIPINQENCGRYIYGQYPLHYHAYVGDKEGLREFIESKKYEVNFSSKKNRSIIGNLLRSSLSLKEKNEMIDFLKKNQVPTIPEDIISSLKVNSLFSEREKIEFLKKLFGKKIIFEDDECHTDMCLYLRERAAIKYFSDYLKNYEDAKNDFPTDAAKRQQEFFMSGKFVSPDDKKLLRKYWGPFYQEKLPNNMADFQIKIDFLLRLKKSQRTDDLLNQGEKINLFLENQQKVFETIFWAVLFDNTELLQSLFTSLLQKIPNDQQKIWLKEMNNYQWPFSSSYFSLSYWFTPQAEFSKIKLGTLLQRHADSQVQEMISQFSL